MSVHMPANGNEARAFLDRAEASDRKNARVIDKIMIALPRELSPKERAELVQDFASELTGNRVPWMAAIHQRGSDENNPHAHIIIRDRDIETGKRVLRLSDSAKDWQKAGRLGEAPMVYVRQTWEAKANEHLAKAGHDVRIDHRSLKDQGIDREPTIKIGPGAQHVETQKFRPESRERLEKSWRRTQYRDRVPYPDIDLGRTRRERNSEIVDLNLERDARSPHFGTRVWAQFEKEQLFRDRNLERDLVAGARRRTREQERIKKTAQDTAAQARESRAGEIRAATAAIEARRAAELGRLEFGHSEQLTALQGAQNSFTSRFLRTIDITGRTKRKQDKERRELEARQHAERIRLQKELQAGRRLQVEAIRARSAAVLADIRTARKAGLKALEDRHADQLTREDALRQLRAAERERGRIETQKQIDAWKVQAKEQEQAKKRAVAGQKPKPSPAPAPKSAAPKKPTREQFRKSPELRKAAFDAYAPPKPKEPDLAKEANKAAGVDPKRQKELERIKAKRKAVRDRKKDKEGPDRGRP